MNNDDSFNDSDEIFSLYSSKKVTDTFKAQLKKIAANNHHLNNACLKVNNIDIHYKEEKNINQELPSTIGEKVEDPVSKESPEPIVPIGDESLDLSMGFNDNSLEDSIEVITEIIPRRTTRQSERLRTRRVHSSCGVYNSWNTDEDILVPRQTRSKKNGPKQKMQHRRQFVEEVTINDSLQQTETEDELNPELTVKVIWKSVNMKKFQIRKFQKLSYIFEQLSKEENIAEDKIILTFNNVRISQNDTPDSLNLQVYHFLDGGVLSELSNFSDTQDTQVCDCESHCVVVKFQDINKKVIRINLNKNEKLKVGMIKCSEQLEIPLKKIRFYFDGELLDPYETPLSLGLEDEEIIDIKISS